MNNIRKFMIILNEADFPLENSLPEFNKLTKFCQAYFEAMLWTEEERLSKEIDDHNINYHNIDPDCVLAQIAQCEKFKKNAANALAEAYAKPGYNEEKAGHDFWLTRNRHGAGCKMSVLVI